MPPIGWSFLSADPEALIDSLAEGLMQDASVWTPRSGGGYLRTGGTITFRSWRYGTLDLAAMHAGLETGNLPVLASTVRAPYRAVPRPVSMLA